MKKLFQKGFTLIELLVVISIIGILTTLVAANLNSARSRARDATRKSDIRNIATALRLYFNDWGQYPPTVSDNGIGSIGGCGSGNGSQPTSLCSWGTAFSDGTTVYMTKLPADPLPNQAYFYKRDPTFNDQYVLSACLENKSDTSGVAVDTSGSNGYKDTTICPSQWVFLIKP